MDRFDNEIVKGHELNVHGRMNRGQKGKLANKGGDVFDGDIGGETHHAPEVVSHGLDALRWNRDLSRATVDVPSEPLDHMRRRLEFGAIDGEAKELKQSEDEGKEEFSLFRAGEKAKEAVTVGLDCYLQAVLNECGCDLSEQTEGSGAGVQPHGKAFVGEGASVMLKTQMAGSRGVKWNTMIARFEINTDPNRGGCKGPLEGERRREVKGRRFSKVTVEGLAIEDWTPVGRAMLRDSEEWEDGEREGLVHFFNDALGSEVIDDVGSGLEQVCGHRRTWYTKVQRRAERKGET